MYQFVFITKRPDRWCAIVLLLAGLLSPLQAEESPAIRPQVAIILDDAGMKNGHYQEMMALPQPVTIAIIPGTACATQVLAEARSKGFDAIGHIPMQPENTNYHKAVVAPFMTADQIRTNLNAALNRLPGIVGINNHMGSLESLDRRTLGVVMEVLKPRDLFMIDSRTNLRSVVAQVAREHGVPCVIQDEFLDGVQKPDVIKGNLDRLLARARRRGYAVGIAHVTRPVTMAVLGTYMQQHAGEVQFVGVTLILHRFRGWNSVQPR